MPGFKRRTKPLMRKADLPFAAVAALVHIGPKGGVIDLLDAGLRITIPAGAVDENTMFNVDAHDEAHAFSVRMHPHQTLAIPATIEQTLDESLDVPNLVLAHTASIYDLTEADAYFAVTKQDGVASAKVPHFSGYMWATGEACDPGPDNPDCIPVDDI